MRTPSIYVGQISRDNTLVRISVCSYLYRHIPFCFVCCVFYSFTMLQHSAVVAPPIILVSLLSTPIHCFTARARLQCYLAINSYLLPLSSVIRTSWKSTQFTP
ncbi:uncharacterized protein EI90DRAFT_483770 [Cantharellus anzutake]|uniref:uncharacterized protein n=1 Tax=Cantharellus anzutake TaxID=1750568 RepID=UPI001908D941|nr:uncharacterized protein EI90DRAFT_483770 [Cantharellus anzutake]KAF8333915.1 hypothetical protein EI90DRAFT_483770 [Cantharellus anzutake]